MAKNIFDIWSKLYDMGVEFNLSLMRMYTGWMSSASEVELKPVRSVDELKVDQKYIFVDVTPVGIKESCICGLNVVIFKEFCREVDLMITQPQVEYAYKWWWGVIRDYNKKEATLRAVFPYSDRNLEILQKMKDSGKPGFDQYWSKLLGISNENMQSIMNCVKCTIKKF